MTRTFDLLAAALGLLILLPFLLVIALVIKLEGLGPVFFRQVRIGKGGRPFRIWKFRTMVVEAERTERLITVGEDRRITRTGAWLRSWKLDELPQLINVLVGEMAFVGPRPEVPRYVALYTAEQRRVLDLRPGITDLASIAYRNESDLLQAQEDPEAFYIHHILPDKIRMNLDYAAAASTWRNIKVILATLGLIPLRGIKPS
jgi:lipopolysaccharide/colanic/teichoic acid biosynthesis glycosyltransferase